MRDIIDSTHRHISLDTRPKSVGRLRPAVTCQRRQLQQVRKAKQGPPLSQVLIRVAGAQIGPFNGDTKECPIRALKKNPLLFLQGPSVQENEPFSVQGMKRMGDRYRGIRLTVCSSSG